MIRPTLIFAFILLWVPLALAADTGVFGVRDFGAAGDGKTLDNACINRAIDACSAAGGGTVRFTAGKYLTGTIHLKSNVTILVEDGAEIIGTSDLNQYDSPIPDGSAAATKGSKDHWHRALVLGQNLENVAVTGRGVINGNKVLDAGGEEHMRGPHAILLRRCRAITLRDFSIRDAANYAVLLERCSQVEARGMKITGGWDGIHFRGTRDDPCKDVTISNCEFYTGDDCIAGWYWQDTLIDRCIINSSCNGIRLIGPASGLIVHDCLFFGPGRYEHRTSREKHRTNMLAGLCLQPGAWERADGPVDGVHISDVVMHDVATPLHLVSRPGNTIGRVTVDRLTATGVYRAAMSVESWGEQPVSHVELRDSTVQFIGGGTSEQAAQEVHAPGVDARPLPAWGLFARHVTRLDLVNVRLSVDKEDARPAMICDGVETLAMDDVKFPQSSHQQMVLKDVAKVLEPFDAANKK